MADPPMPLHSVPFAAPADGSLLDWIDDARQVVRQDGVHLSSLCTRLADALADWKWPTDKDGNVVPGRHLPVHDKHSHPGTALVFGMRTRWQGDLLVIGEHGRGRAAAEALAVTETDDRGRRRRGDEASGRGRRTREADLIGHAHEDDDDDEWDEDDE